MPLMIVELCPFIVSSSGPLSNNCRCSEYSRKVESGNFSRLYQQPLTKENKGEVMEGAYGQYAKGRACVQEEEGYRGA